MAQNGRHSSDSGLVPFPCFHKLDTAQDVLDRNKTIIQQIKANHASQAAEDLSKNCVLIKELNGNIAQVVHLYQEISDSYVRYMGLSASDLSAPSPEKLRQQAPAAGSAEPGSAAPVAQPPGELHPAPEET